MNIQEGIKELESHKMKSEDIRAIRYNDGINTGIAVMEKLDEPQKPVVPKFVADWFEDAKDNLETSIFYECVRAMEICKGDRNEFHQWFANSKNNPIETLIHMKDGYEVKKEPLYRVKLGEGYFVEYQGRDALIMIIPDDNKEIKIFDSKSEAERTAQTIGGTVEEVW
ncbi:DUF1642 domain-containing protein [Enterococcus faecium]|uniref:DUF1642 domain-containing protein n=1 Tax=Enterococcus faecium TaxID=1352 RepID=A0AB73NAQ2_ENTFC|nr:DUF1642 domain-containing protein [Enterococcus faecium]EGP5129986.1 DUF1642 domain-containing protein [Enterococcus faecium]OTO00450.1 hypothetical protein A5804_001960 [Enterococcus faecium]